MVLFTNISTYSFTFPFSGSNLESATWNEYYSGSVYSRYVILIYILHALRTRVGLQDLKNVIQNTRVKKCCENNTVPLLNVTV